MNQPQPSITTNPVEPMQLSAIERTRQLCSQISAILERQRNAVFLVPIIVPILLFVLTVALKIHGYSIPLLSKYIDSSAPKSTLLGQLKPIRSDDWAVTLPHALAQWAHTPAFPVKNYSIQAGQNMFVMANIPILDWSLLFRPQSLGFFVDPGTGVAWFWGFNVYATFVVAFLLFWRISGRSILIGITGALCLLYSPFLQFWGLNCAPVTVFCLLIILLFAQLFRTQKVPQRAAISIGIGWASMCFIHTFYPPYVVSLGLVAAFACLGIVLNNLVQKGPRQTAQMIAWVAPSLLIVLVGSVSLFQHLRDVIPVMMQTEYPGQRITVGGSLETWQLFLTHLQKYNRVDYSLGLRNVCEASGFLVFFPFSLALIFSRWQTNHKSMFIHISLLACCAMFLVWMFVPTPSWYGALTLLNRVPETRLKLAFGISDLLLFAASAGLPFSAKQPFKNAKLRFAAFSLLSGCWLLSLFLFLRHHESFGIKLATEHMTGVIVSEIIFVALAFYVPRFSLLFRALCLIPLTIAFNPIVKDGTSFLYNNPLGKRIIELNKETKYGTKWIVYGRWPLSNYVRTLGVNLLSGTQFTPDIALMSKFDPTASAKSIYNRYAAMSTSQNHSLRPTFRLIQLDAFDLAINPETPILAELGYDYFLTEGDCAFLCSNPKFERLFTYKDKMIFRRREVNKN